MAIKVNGTTVIDDNRNLVNIVSGAGASTDFGAVGTYCFAYTYQYDASFITRGSTIAGSSLRPAGLSSNSANLGTVAALYSGTASIYIGTGTNASTLSGTWRAMGETQTYYNLENDAPALIYVRIS